MSCLRKTLLCCCFVGFVVYILEVFVGFYDVFVEVNFVEVVLPPVALDFEDETQVTRLTWERLLPDDPSHVLNAFILLEFVILIVAHLKNFHAIASQKYKTSFYERWKKLKKNKQENCPILKKRDPFFSK